MTDYGVTTIGFIRKPFEIIEKEIEAKARTLFGEDIDLSIYSPVGLFVKLLSWNNHVLWQDLEKAYYSNWIDTAEGVNLDRVVRWGGISRQGPQKSVIQEMVFTGIPGTEIPAGFQVQTPQGIEFITNSETKIGEDNKAVVSCTAVEGGAHTAVPSGAVTEIVESMEGVSSVVNSSASLGGRDFETDAELRLRYSYEGSEYSGSSIDAIRSSLLKVDDVITANVYENIEITSDAETGMPPKSIECLVLGGTESDIAQAIFGIKPAGIETYGNITETAIDQAGKGYPIYFNRPKERNVYVYIDIVKNDEFNQEAALVEIKTNVIKYIGGVDTIDVDGEQVSTYHKGLEVGEDVFPWRIAAVNREISGIDDIQVQIGLMDKTGTATSGYQDYIPHHDSDFSFVSADATGITAGTYYLYVNVDGTQQSVSVNLLAGNTWGDVVTALNTGLTNGSAALENMGTTENPIYCIRVTSSSTGVQSKIRISEPFTNGLLYAIEHAVVTAEKPYLVDPLDGMDIVGVNKIALSSREIGRCNNDLISITINA